MSLKSDIREAIEEYEKTGEPSFFVFTRSDGVEFMAELHYGNYGVIFHEMGQLGLLWGCAYIVDDDLESFFFLSKPINGYSTFGKYFF
jgi:hypothetical protein